MESGCSKTWPKVGVVQNPRQPTSHRPQTTDQAPPTRHHRPGTTDQAPPTTYLKITDHRSQPTKPSTIDQWQ